MTIEPVKKTTAELLAYQTELLEKIATTGLQILEKQSQIADSQITWLKSIDERANRQIGFLKSINSFVTFFGIVLVLSVCAGLYQIISVISVPRY